MKTGGCREDRLVVGEAIAELVDAGDPLVDFAARGGAVESTPEHRRPERGGPVAVGELDPEPERRGREDLAVVRGRAEATLRCGERRHAAFVQLDLLGDCPAMA